MFTFFWNHKIISVLLILTVFYWVKNPSNKIGFAGKGYIVYDKVPVIFFDVFINQTGKVFIQDDITDPTTLKYWADNQLQVDSKSNDWIPLVVGTGFDSTKFTFPKEILEILRVRRISIKQMPTKEAIVFFNGLRDSTKPAMALIKVTD